MDKNIVLLEGVIGTDYKISRSNSGSEYITFTLRVKGGVGRYKDKTEERSETMLRIFIFDNRLVEYMRSVGAKVGNRVSILARLNSHRTEIKGEPIIQCNIVVRSISVLRTKEDGLVHK